MPTTQPCAPPAVLWNSDAPTLTLGSLPTRESLAKQCDASKHVIRDGNIMGNIGLLPSGLRQQLTPLLEPTGSGAQSGSETMPS